MINQDAVIGMAIATAFFRSEWTTHTSIAEVDAENGWDEIIEMANGYCEAAGLKNASVSKAMVLEAIWGIDDPDEIMVRG